MAGSVINTEELRDLLVGAGSARRLGVDEVHVWCVDVAVPEARARALEATLTPDELARAWRFRFSHHRHRFVAARGILRSILAFYLCRPPAELRFRYGRYGKPALDGAGEAEVRFNLSHADELAVYAFARARELGVDVERIHPHPRIDETAGRYLPPGDRAMIRRLPQEARLEAFYRCWVRQEAFAKACGRGLASASSLLDEESGSERPQGSAGAEGLSPQGSPWSLREFDPSPGYVAALVVEGGGWQLVHQTPAPASMGDPRPG